MFLRRIEHSITVINFLYHRMTFAKKAEITMHLHVSDRYTESIIRPLIKAGIITSHLGKYGGYELTDGYVVLEEVLIAWGYSMKSRKRYSTMLLSAPIRELLR